MITSKLILFFSADLCGSTAYKNKSQNRAAGIPPWFSLYQRFFDELPDALIAKCQSLHCKSEKPKIWKILGDEILLTQAISDIDDVEISISAFKSALIHVLISVQKLDPHLGIKGTVWTSGFPIINSEILILDSKVEVRSPHQITKTKTPKSLDYLGPSIDTGFRISKYATPTRIAISAETAWILASRSEETRVSKRFEIFYDGEAELKGVLRGKPYPLFSIDAGDPLEAHRNLLAHRLPAKNADIINFVKLFTSIVNDPFLMVLPYLSNKKKSWHSIPSVHKHALNAYFNPINETPIQASEQMEPGTDLPIQKFSEQIYRI